MISFRFSLHHFRRHGSGLMLALAALGLSGCASLSESECLKADWQRYGLRDGRSGMPADRVDEHAKACGKVGVQPDAERWRQGWEQGIAQYCMPENGWRVGLRGEFDRGACDERPDGDQFQRLYEAGRRIHELTQQLDRNHREVQRLERELANAKTDEERKRLRAQLRELDYEQRRLRSRYDLEMLQAPRRY